jgi:hypothetical protein
MLYGTTLEQLLADNYKYFMNIQPSRDFQETKSPIRKE